MKSTNSVVKEFNITFLSCASLVQPSAEVSSVILEQLSLGLTTPSSPAPPGTWTPTTLPGQPISNSFLFACICGRCGDVSASERAHTLKTLGGITGDQGRGVKDVLDTIFSQDKASRGKLSLTDMLRILIWICQKLTSFHQEMN